MTGLFGNKSQPNHSIGMSPVTNFSPAGGIRSLFAANASRMARQNPGSAWSQIGQRATDAINGSGSTAPLPASLAANPATPLAPQPTQLTQPASSLPMDQGQNCECHASGGGVRNALHAYSHSGPVIEKGFLASDGAGRTDNLAITVPHGAHVIPADIVSVLGQGNSAAGAKHLREALDHLGAHERRASGGKTGDSHTPILAAGGEFIVSPAEVNAIGHGSQKKGHDALDAMIVTTRKAGAKRMLKLKGPKR